jgi:predicted nucleic acid-binding protein
MPTLTHMLDTSALLAHYFGEPGAEQVSQLWSHRTNRIAVCALTLPELRTALEHVVSDTEEVARAFHLYIDDLTVTVPATRSVAELAIELRKVAAERLPLVDSIIAACAKEVSAVLVHRDPHLATIPQHAVRQLVLPDKV